MIKRNYFINLNLFEIKEKIGEGSYGKVYKVIDKTNGKIYAAKISKMKLEESDRSSLLNLVREIVIMMQLKHPSIVNFIGYSPINFKQKTKPVIITDFLNNGTLHDIVEKERKGISQKNWKTCYYN